jgi:hypothetical protein
MSTFRLVAKYAPILECRTLVDGVKIGTALLQRADFSSTERSVINGGLEAAMDRFFKHALDLFGVAGTTPDEIRAWSS